MMMNFHNVIVDITVADTIFEKVVRSQWTLLFLLA